MPVDFSSFSLEVIRGDTSFIDFAVTLGGSPQNITGWALWFTAKRRVGDADPGVLQKSTNGGGVTITNAVGGLGTVTVAPADTTALPEERTTLYADLQGRDGAGNIFTLSTGLLTVASDVTQTTL